MSIGGERLGQAGVRNAIEMKNPFMSKPACKPVPLDDHPRVVSRCETEPTEPLEYAPPCKVGSGVQGDFSALLNDLESDCRTGGCSRCMEQTMKFETTAKTLQNVLQVTNMLLEKAGQDKIDLAQFEPTEKETQIWERERRGVSIDKGT
jgi:hypothetical protein